MAGSEWPASFCATERSAQTGVSERVLCRKIATFGEEVVESLFSWPKAIGRKTVDSKAGDPQLNQKVAEGPRAGGEGPDCRTGPQVASWTAS